MQLVKKNTLSSEEQKLYDEISFFQKGFVSSLKITNVYNQTRTWKQQTAGTTVKLTGTCNSKEDIEFVLDPPHIKRKVITIILLWYNGSLPPHAL